MAKLQANNYILGICDLQFVLLFTRNFLSILMEIECKLHMKVGIFCYSIYGIDSLTINLVPSGQQVLNKHLLNKSE